MEMAKENFLIKIVVYSYIKNKSSTVLSGLYKWTDDSLNYL